MLALCVAIVAVFLITRINGGTPTVFGYSIYRVSSGSMEPELMTGDVILNKTVDDISALKVGDIITFEGSGETEGMLITHAIIVAPHTGENGSIVLQTKGNANEVADAEITADSIKSIMICKIPFLDEVYTFFLSPWGLLTFIGLLVLVFFDEVINIVRILTGNVNDEDQEDINKIIERVQREDLQKKPGEKDDQSHKSKVTKTDKNVRKQKKSRNKSQAHIGGRKNQNKQHKKKLRKIRKKQRINNQKIRKKSKNKRV